MTNKNITNKRLLELPQDARDEILRLSAELYSLNKNIPDINLSTPAPNIKSGDKIMKTCFYTPQRRAWIREISEAQRETEQVMQFLDLFCVHHEHCQPMATKIPALLRPQAH